MKLTNILTGLAATAVLLTAVPLAEGRERWDAPGVVTTNCSGCHGIDGNAQLPYFPKLAGINVAYGKKKMAAFREAHPPPVDDLFGWILGRPAEKKDAVNTGESRINMVGMAHAATVEQSNEAVLWYSKQEAAGGHSAEAAQVERGMTIFMKGLPAQKVLACQLCHGANAHGKGLAPRLAGQNAEYLMGQLAKFRKGDRRHAPEMTMETRDLDTEQARAAAAYLQSR